MCLLSRLGGVAAGDGCLFSLDGQFPLVAGQVGGGRHQRIYGPHRARHKLHIPEPSKQRGLARCRSRPMSMFQPPATQHDSVSVITILET